MAFKSFISLENTSKTREHKGHSVIQSAVDLDGVSDWKGGIGLVLVKEKEGNNKKKKR